MTESQKESVLARLQNLIPSDEYNTPLMEQLVDDAESFALAYTNRTRIPDSLIRTIGDLAIVAFNRLGTEGDAGRSEAGESYTFETAPAHIFSILNNHRIARCGGRAHEAETSTDDQS